MTDVTDVRAVSEAGKTLLELRHVARTYRAGDETVHALRGVSLTIVAGELIAIMGSSGSGKSTLLNILGCLDKPDAGSYLVAGEETGAMTPDDLSRLRREHFGFIFQRYQLLDDLTALRNVEMPAIYAGVPADERHARATALLTRLGLGGRLTHRPNELSGGQQQRVSIARALVNGGQVILADEPTGALDAVSSEDVLEVLQELNAQGHTVIIVTHDADVAAHAHRIIELRDGVVVADRVGSRALAAAMRPLPAEQDGSRFVEMWSQAGEAAAMAVRNMIGHRMRTLLTMLGIVIGIASVVTVSAIGEGSRRTLAAQLSTLGTNTIDLFTGRGFGDQRADAKKPLTVGDAQALAGLDYIDSVSPVVTTFATVRRGNVERSAQVRGVARAALPRARLRDHRRSRLRRTCCRRSGAGRRHRRADAGRVHFPTAPRRSASRSCSAAVPVRVVGVVARPKSPFLDNGLNIYVPYTTALTPAVRRHRVVDDHDAREGRDAHPDRRGRHQEPGAPAPRPRSTSSSTTRKTSGRPSASPKARCRCWSRRSPSSRSSSAESVVHEHHARHRERRARRRSASAWRWARDVQISSGNS